MIYWFRVYGRGWFVSNNRKLIERKLKAYQKEGLVRDPTIHRNPNWVVLD